MLLVAGAARAQDTAADVPKAITLSGEAGAVSDYRFRGVSRSDLGPAAQGSVRVDSAHGFYAAAWASTISPRANGGASGEVDLYAGWSGKLGGWTADGGLYGYVFPGGRNRDFYEAYGALTRDLGPLSGTVGVNYAPDVRGRDNAYLYTSLSAGVPRTPLTLRAGVGYENGALGNRKLDWQLGASVRRGRFSAGLSYADSSAPGRLARAGPALSLGAKF